MSAVDGYICTACETHLDRGYICGCRQPIAGLGARLVRARRLHPEGSSLDPIGAERAELLERKLRVDEQIGSLKADLVAAKTRAFSHGVYLEPHVFKSMHRRLNELRVETTTIQQKLTELRQREKERNIRESNTDAQRFMKAARRVLSSVDFERIEDAMEQEAAQ